MEQKDVILVDYRETDEWEFKKGLEKITGGVWKLDSRVANIYHKGFDNFFRYGIYFTFPLKYVFRIKQYRNIIAWQQLFGLILAGYLKVLHISNVVGKIYIMELIYKRKKGFKGKIYESFVRYAITSEYIEKIFVFSVNERKQYASLFALPEDKFEVLQLGITDVFNTIKHKITDDGYFLAPGRSNRDWDFLVKIWDSKRRLKIVCDNYKGDDKANIEVLGNCYKDDYMEQLLHCHAIIVPLTDENISSGQLVILQGKMLGKPVIVTDNCTVREYFVDGEDGYIIKKQKTAFQDALAKLDDRDEYQRISRNARKNFEKAFSVTAMGESVGRFVNQHNRQ